MHAYTKISVNIGKRDFKQRAMCLAVDVIILLDGFLTEDSIDLSLGENYRVKLTSLLQPPRFDKYHAIDRH